MSEQLRTPYGWPKRHCLTFQVGKHDQENAHVFVKADAVLERNETVVFLGSRGTGKTYASMIVAAMWLAKNEDRRTKWAEKENEPHCSYWELIDLMQAEQATFGHKREHGETTPIQQSQRAHMLCLDEIHERDGRSPWWDLTLTRLLRERYNEMLPTILVGNCKASELQNVLGDSVASRLLEAGAVFELKKNYRTQ